MIIDRISAVGLFVAGWYALIASWFDHDVNTQGLTGLSGVLLSSLVWRFAGKLWGDDD